MLKIVADQNMLMVDELFGHLGPIEYIPGRQITAADVVDADLLLVRSVTKVDESLLKDSAVTFVGSATIGTDHVDLDYLQRQGIRFAHAPGCNAMSVVQYVLSVLSNLQPDWLSCSIGIVGCGNVGGSLYRTLRSLGLNCSVYDPFLSSDNNPDLVDFATVLRADVICVHTPLTTSGRFPTKHLFNAEVLASLPPETLLINAGRGPVIDNSALLSLLQRGSKLSVALDVWEPEPTINCQLLDLVRLATPHIAGYSREGKLRGTEMLAEAFCQWRGLNAVERAANKVGSASIQAASLSEAILAAYNVADDDRRMREAINIAGSPDSVAVAFDRLRKEYPRRHEFTHYTANVPKVVMTQTQLLGFLSGL